MIQKLAILGATSDLAARYLLPALAALRAAGSWETTFGLSRSAGRTGPTRRSGIGRR
jgi:glucose-6-phosphate 1-dehydrogenase